MTKQSGRLGQLLIAKESARGTSTVTNGLWIPRSTISFDDKIESAREAEGVGKLADSDALFVTQKMAKGEFESNLDDKLAGIILTGLLGASPVITGGNPYTHTYTLSNTNQHQSVSVLYQDLDTAKMYSLGSIDSLKIAVEQNGIVQFTVGILSRVGKDWARQTATFNTLGNKFLHQHLQFRLADTIAGLTGATALSLKKLEINFTKNSIHDQVLGTVEPEDVLATNFSVEGSMELLKSDETYRNYMLNGTYKSMEVRFERSSVNSQLKMQFPRVDFTEWEQDRKLDDIVSQKINFKANVDNANALDIISTCTLINTYAGTAY